MTAYETLCTGPHCNRKRLYRDRATARKAAKQIPGQRMHAYACPHVPGNYHLGHLPASVRRGETSKRTYEARVARRQERAS